MTWWESYCDCVIEDPLLDGLIGKRLSDDELHRFPTLAPTIGGFSKAAASQVSIWRKLIQSSLGLSALELWFGTDEGFLSDYAPRSRHNGIFVAQTNGWELLHSSEIIVSYAVFSNVQGIRLGFKGLPTEEGLDRIVQFSLGASSI